MVHEERESAWFLLVCSSYGVSATAETKTLNCAELVTERCNEKGYSLFVGLEGVHEGPNRSDRPIPTLDTTEGIHLGIPRVSGLHVGSVIRTRTTELAGAQGFGAHEANGKRPVSC